MLLSELKLCLGSASSSTNLYPSLTPDGTLSQPRQYSGVYIPLLWSLNPCSMLPASPPSCREINAHGMLQKAMEPHEKTDFLHWCGTWTVEVWGQQAPPSTRYKKYSYVGSGQTKSLQKTVLTSKLQQASSGQILKISRDGDFTSSLGPYLLSCHLLLLFLTDTIKSCWFCSHRLFIGHSS